MSDSKSSYSNRTLILCAVASSILSSLLTFSAVWMIPNGFGSTHGFAIAEASRAGGVALGEEVNGLIPEFPRLIQIQQNKSEYGVYSDQDLETVLDRWQNFFPLGDGFINVPDIEEYDLPPPMIYKRWDSDNTTYKDESWYSISVFHQLHCLTGILDDYISSHHPNIASKRRREEQLSPTGHVLHCFDYIREAIMCHADTALEGADLSRGRNELTDGTFGTGTKHVCKDWGTVFKYAESNGNKEWGKKSSGSHHHHHDHGA